MSAKVTTHATKLGPGSYVYRGCLITIDHDSETYSGWWMIADKSPWGVGWDLDNVEYFPTKRAAMSAIDSQPPSDQTYVGARVGAW